MASWSWGLCAVLLMHGALAKDVSPQEDVPTADEAYLEFMDTLMSNAMLIESTPSLAKQYAERIRMVERAEEDFGINYHCNPESLSLSPTPPTSVHKLRPSDISVVSAFGDSITACNGCGARNMLELAVEKRGESWSVGGDRNIDEGFVTIPNIFRKFKSRPAGYSTCASLQYSKLAWLNVAKPGATCTHMPGQAVKTVEIMKADSHIDFENDWKLITLFIGGNDLCGYCRRPTTHSPENHRNNIEIALDTLKAEVPRAFVQIVTMFDVTPVTNMSRSAICSIMQMGWCECAVNKTMQPTLKQIHQQYYEQLLDLVQQPKYHTSDDFTVVLQHHMKDVKPYYDVEKGAWDSSYLSVDCFHPNIKGHRGMASWLWNAMLWPVGQKPYDQDMTASTFEICCPTEEYPYLFTAENSKNLPDNPWTPGQVCWNPSSSRRTMHKGRPFRQVARPKRSAIKSPPIIKV